MKTEVILPLLFTTLFSGFAGGALGAIITYIFQSRLLNRQLGEQGRIANDNLAEQRRIAGDKLRLDLFDRRYEVFEATRKFLKASIQDYSHIDQHLRVFKDETSHAEFLFGSDVLNYLEKVARAKDDDPIWLSKRERITEMTKTFAPYLGFENIKA